MQETRKKRKEVLERIEIRNNFANEQRLSNEENEVEDEYKVKENQRASNIKIEQIQRVEESIFKDKIKKIVDSKIFNIIIFVISIYSLFADDLKLLFLPKGVDSGFSSISIVIIIIFVTEIIFTVIVDEQYICGLYFYIDVISTFSLILDIHWIYAKLNSQGSRAIMQVGKGGRLAARAIRLLRFIRTIRTFTKAHKLATINKYKNESQAGKKILELTTKRVIFLIVMLIVALICFDIEVYSSPLSKTEFSLDVFSYVKNSTQLNYLFDKFKSEMNIEKGTVSLISARVYNYSYNNTSKDDSTYRDWEKELIEVPCNYSQFDLNSNFSTCYATFDVKEQVRFSSQINIIKTLFIIFMITASTIAFNRDTSRIISQPINNMIKNIKNITNNPIEAMLNETNDKSDNKDKNSKLYNFFCKSKALDTLETKIIEKAISKIGALLALGFGEAGSEIVAKNMKESGEGEINPMIEGKKVMAVYGFCDIRNFTDTTEELEEDVMIFVNRIGEIVHEIVNENCGSANKNIGDAFLLVWKFDERFVDQKLVNVNVTPIKLNLNNKYNNVSSSLGNDYPINKNSDTLNFVQKNSFQIETSNIKEYKDSTVEEEHKNKKRYSLSPNIYNARINKINNDSSINKTYNNSNTIIYPGGIGPKVSKNNFAQSFISPLKAKEFNFKGLKNQHSIKRSIFMKNTNGYNNINTNPNDKTSLYNSKSPYLMPQQIDITLKNCNEVNQIVDMALISFAQIVINIHKSKVLDFYRHHEKLNKRIPFFCVKMGFGLHLGWSIEGAIGSSFKIDASYLSPHVNMANKLEEGTKSYKVQMILSDEFVKYLSKDSIKQIRVIDRLKNPHDGKTYCLHTLDIDLTKIPIDEKEDVAEDQMERYLRKRKERKEKLHKILYEKKFNVWKEFEENHFYKLARQKYTEEFYSIYNRALEYYANGDFKRARVEFILADDTLELRDKGLLEYERIDGYSIQKIQSMIVDGPIKNFVEFIDSFEGNYPKDWDGFKYAEE